LKLYRGARWAYKDKKLVDFICMGCVVG